LANLTKNISNTVLVLGPPSNWGQLVWGVDRWGDSDGTAVRFSKVISNSQTISEAVSTTAKFIRTFAIGTFVGTHDVSPGLKNGNWDYVLNLDETSYTAGSRPDVTFVCQAAAGTVWSEA
jgi:hypothetical protein